MTLSYTDAFGTKTSQVMAIWIETSTGTFVKTLRRNVGANSTNDHINTFNVKSGGTACNVSGGCALSGNVTGATTGATLKTTTTPTGFGVKNNIAVWDGTNAAGTLMPDGVYKVWIEACSNATATGTHEVLTSFTFNKIATSETINQTSPAVSGTAGTGLMCMFTYTLVKTVWATTVGVDVNVKPEFSIYPNPSNGVFNVNFSQVNNIKVVNTLGAVIFEEKVDASAMNKTIDLSGFANGIYFISVSNSNGTSNKKIILEK